MEAKKYIEKMNQSNSYWEMKCGKVVQLNNTAINGDNVYLVFWCISCDGDDGKDYHMISYKDLQLDHEGDYLAFCPNGEHPLGNYLCHDSLPKELQTLFEKTEFEKYKK